MQWTEDRGQRKGMVIGYSLLDVALRDADNDQIYFRGP